MFLNVKDIMDMFGVSQSHAYRVIVDLNNLLEKKGFRTIKGKVSRKFVFENYYINEHEVKHVSLQR